MEAEIDNRSSTRRRVDACAAPEDVERVQHLLAFGPAETKGYDTRDARHRPETTATAEFNGLGIHGGHGQGTRSPVRYHGEAWSG